MKQVPNHDWGHPHHDWGHPLFSRECIRCGKNYQAYWDATYEFLMKDGKYVPALNVAYAINIIFPCITDDELDIKNIIE